MNDWEQTCNAETAGATQKAITSMAETLHHLRCLKLIQPRKWCDRLSFNLCRISAINSICLISGTCQDRSFSIVFRTFGSDLPAVQAEFNAFCAPWRQFGRTLPMASKEFKRYVILVWMFCKIWMGSLRQFWKHFLLLCHSPMCT